MIRLYTILRVIKNDIGGWKWEILTNLITGKWLKLSSKSRLSYSHGAANEFNSYKDTIEIMTLFQNQCICGKPNL